MIEFSRNSNSYSKNKGLLCFVLLLTHQTSNGVLAVISMKYVQQPTRGYGHPEGFRWTKIRELEFLREDVPEGGWCTAD